MKQVVEQEIVPGLGDAAFIIDEIEAAEGIRLLLHDMEVVLRILRPGPGHEPVAALAFAQPSGIAAGRRGKPPENLEGAEVERAIGTWPGKANRHDRQCDG